jgi:dTMP kinase
MRTWMRQLAGRFIVFDGPDGSGKSTQFARFAAACREAGVAVCEVREPGGTEIGEQIRQILLDPANHEMDLRCEMLLYMASRAQLVAQTIRPALERDELVLADRFISSTLAYQGTAGGIGIDAIEQVGEVALCGAVPDLVVVFDVDERTAAARLAGTSRHTKLAGAIEPTLFSDRMERKGVEFHRRVRRGYLDQAERDDQRYIVIDASADVDVVTEMMMQRIGERLTA